MTDPMTKEGIATRRVAMLLCGSERGGRIPTIAEMVERCDCSRGYVQKALENLSSYGAILIEPHGKQGTELLSIDYSKIADLCGLGHIVGAMPLPYTRRYEGLATGLFTMLSSESIRSFITFQRGSESRLQTLLDGMTDYCVMSSLAYSEYVSRGFEIAKVLDCGSRTYVGRHLLFSRDEGRTDWSGSKVGIDENSADQRLLTRRFFAPFQVEYVDVQYTHILEMICDGSLDAGIWNEDDVHLGSVGTLHTYELPDGGGDDSAVIVARRDDALTRELIRSLVKPAELRRVQERVMSGAVQARY